jgi:hypothetical protein
MGISHLLLLAQTISRASIKLEEPRPEQQGLPLGGLPVMWPQPSKGTMSKLIPSPGLILADCVINLSSSELPFVRDKFEYG